MAQRSQGETDQNALGGTRDRGGNSSTPGPQHQHSLLVTSEGALLWPALPWQLALLDDLPFWELGVLVTGLSDVVSAEWLCSVLQRALAEMCGRLHSP